MSISCITNKFFPCSAKPASLVTTGSLVVAVAAAVLIGVAYALQWGMPAIYASSGVATVATLITLALIACRKQPSEQDRTFDQLPLPLPEDSANVLQVGTKHELILTQFYTLIRRGNVTDFQNALSLYSPTEFTRFALNSHIIFLDENDTSTNLDATKKHGHSLFNIVFSLKENRTPFLKACLTQIKDHYVDIWLEERIIACLQIQDPELITLFIRKLAPQTLQAFMKTALEPKQPANFLWIQTYLNAHPSRESLKKLCPLIISSQLLAEQKKFLLQQITLQSKCQLVDLTFDALYSRDKGWSQYYRGDILHLAIQAKDVELVAFYASLFIRMKPKVDYLAFAVLGGDTKIIEVLLNAGIDPNGMLREYNERLFSKARGQATQITPLMIAAANGRQDIVDMLLRAGANPDIKDHPTDLNAWSMHDYANRKP